MRSGSRSDSFNSLLAKEAVEQLKATYHDEAKKSELDITAKFQVR